MDNYRTYIFYIRRAYMKVDHALGYKTNLKKFRVEIMQCGLRPQWKQNSNYNR